MVLSDERETKAGPLLVKPKGWLNASDLLRHALRGDKKSPLQHIPCISSRIEATTAHVPSGGYA